jgi:hypothetical protein
MLEILRLLRDKFSWTEKYILLPRITFKQPQLRSCESLFFHVNISMLHMMSSIDRDAVFSD